MTTYRSTEYVGTLRGVNSSITVSQQSKCTINFYYIYFISTDVSNVIAMFD
jgi:hypothetical protein